MTSAKIIADSISPSGHRLTTMEVTFHRYVLAEMNTHRAFSRNSASSRAIPLRKQLEKVHDNPALPVVWPSEKPGMQGGEPLSGEDTVVARRMWLIAREHAYDVAKEMGELGVHKSICNRILEPFLWHTAIISATDWDGFWRQRCSPLAQPEFRVAAEMMREAYKASTPERLDDGHWHLPYLDGDTIIHVTNHHPTEQATELLKRISVARCARVSYLTHDGTRDYNKDVEMYDRLVSADPPHASPLEHVATPCPTLMNAGATTCWCPGNFTGWHQMRHEVLGF